MAIKDFVDALLRFIEVITSWPIILLIIFIIFRKPIIILFDDLSARLTDAEIGVGKFKFSSKTTKTPIGDTEISVREKKAARDIDEGIICKYTSAQYKFQISWPNGKWVANNSLNQATLNQHGIPSSVNVPILITKTEKVGDFVPNVNIIVEDCAAMTTDQYMHLSTQKMKVLGWEVYLSKIDANTSSGLIVYSQISPIGRVFQFAKIILRNGLAFVVTASQLPTEEGLTTQTREELLYILNSFSLLN
ncbi:MAG: hypothetical protein ABIK92_12685 [Pseudomonadota bacterium]